MRAFSSERQATNIEDEEQMTNFQQSELGDVDNKLKTPGIDRITRELLQVGETVVKAMNTLSTGIQHWMQYQKKENSTVVPIYKRSAKLTEELAYRQTIPGQVITKIIQNRICRESSWTRTSQVQKGSSTVLFRAVKF